MAAWYLGCAALVGASVVCGQALWSAFGPSRTSWLAPVTGLAALMIVCEVAVRLPGHAVTEVVVAALAIAGSLVVVVRRRLTGGALSIEGAAMTLVVLALVSLPFAVNGRFGLLGTGSNDDTVMHLLAGWWLEHRSGPDFSKIVVSGYPIGPHALMVALAKGLGLSLPAAFTAVIASVPVIGAFTARAALREGPRIARTAVAILVPLCYLDAAYLAQASFKETFEALFVLGFALAAQEGAMGAVGLLGAGAAYVFSYLGVLWLALPVVLLGRRRLREFTPALAIFAVAVLPELNRMWHFRQSGFNGEPPDALGNLLRPLSPFEGLGTWLRGDFRLTTSVVSLGGLLSALALVALVGALVWWWRRGERWVPVTLGVATAIYAVIALTRAPYTAAKALTVLAPLVTLVIGRAALVNRRFALVAVLVLAGSALSSFRVLRDAPVSVPTRTNELARLRPLLGAQPTVFLGNDRYVNWELRGANLSTPPMVLYGERQVPLRVGKSNVRRSKHGQNAPTLNRFAGMGLAYDFDSLPTDVLARFTFAILPRSGYQSTPPTGWRPVAGTRSYVLWRRFAADPPREVLRERDQPGTVLHCSSKDARALLRSKAVATTRPAPVPLNPFGFWHGRPEVAGESAHRTLTLPPGRWQLSLQYASRQPITVDAANLHARLPASLDRLGPYWLAGTVTTTRTTRVIVTVKTDRLPGIGRVLGASRVALIAEQGKLLPALGNLAATRVPVTTARVPLARACGKFVDWYRIFSPQIRRKALTSSR